MAEDSRRRIRAPGRARTAAGDAFRRARRPRRGLRARPAGDPRARPPPPGACWTSAARPARPAPRSSSARRRRGRRRRARARLRARGGDPAGPRDHRRRASTRRARGRFDVLIAADILEHLKDPWSALPRYTAPARARARRRSSASRTSPTGAPTRTSPAAAGRASPRASSTPPTCAGSRCEDANDLLRQAGCTPHTVVRRRWLYTRGSRLDVLAPPLLNIPGADADHLPAHHRRDSLTIVRDMDVAQVRSLQSHGHGADRRAAGLLSGLDRPLGADRVLWEIGDEAPTCARCGRGSASTPATSAA